MALTPAIIPDLARRLKALARRPDVEGGRARTLFVGGAARSGTTMLQNLLCQLPGATPLLPECAPIRFLVQFYLASLNHNAKFPDTFFPDDLRSEFAAMLEARLGHVRDRFRSDVIVLKEPALTAFFAPLAALADAETRFIVLVRDPRDVVASTVEWGQRAASAGERHPFSKRDINDLCRRYIESYRFVMDLPDAATNRFLVVRYESLVHAPGTVMQDILRFVGVDDAEIDHGGGWNGPFADMIRNKTAFHAYSELYGKPVSADNIGRHRAILKPNELYMVTLWMRPIMEVFSYAEAAADP